MPPLLNIPARTADLTAAQQAGELVLTWTLPGETTEGFPLKELDRVVVWGLEVEAQPPEPAGFVDRARPLATLDRPAVEQRASAGSIQQRVKLPVVAGKRVALAVENFSRRGRSEGLSNLVVVEVAPALAAPQTLRAITQAKTIRLEWSQTPGARGYHLYRRHPPDSPAILIAGTTEPSFQDPDFRWGLRYGYFVRAFVTTATGDAESADSQLVEVVPEDIFPPSPPNGLQAVAGPLAVELSWNPSPESDTAGYHVYRGGARINAEPVVAPAFTDKNVQSGQQYSYAISAVDSRGNESAPSPALSVTMP